MESKRNTEDLYNISTYTDGELYEILDLTNDPTDRELEAKILYFIHKYTNMEEKSSKKLAKFFDDIYNHFFDVDSEEDEETIMEGFEAGGLSYEDALVKGNVDLNTKYQMTDKINDPESAALTIKAQKDIAGNIKLNPTKYYNPQDKTVDQGSATTSGVTFTKTLDYATGRLNPLIQQTIKRIVSVDSKYRDDKRTLSTDFTFLLNEPLKDVVSLKLYSIQIPYSWYTVNTNFGGNFFYLKGITPGIDNEFHNILIDISAGNYDGPGLTLTTNNAIRAKTIVYGDVSFGNSNVSINSFTSLTTAQFSLEKKYDENSYYLDFNGCGVSPAANGVPASIGVQAALGFSNQIYYPNTMVSIPFNRSETDPGFYTTGSYVLTSANNYIQVVIYRGPNEWDHISNIETIVSFNIGLSLSTSSASTYYSRQQILENFNSVIKSFNNYLSIDSGLTDPKYNSSVNTNYIIQNYQTPLCYQLKIKPNRSYVRDISNVKIAIKFPTESVQNRIWTGDVTSCFGFYNRTGLWDEMSDVISENPIIANDGNYTIDTGNYILLTCNDPYFNLPANNITITIQPYTNGYSFTEYIDAINAAIASSGTQIIGSNNLNNDAIKNSTAFKDVNEFFNLNLVINQTFNETLYELDLRDSIIKSIFNKTQTSDFISVNGSLTNTDNRISYINNGVSLASDIVIAETTDANNITTITGLTGNITTTGLTYINNNNIMINSNVITTQYISTTVVSGSLNTTNNSGVTITGTSNMSLTNKTINFDNDLTVVGSLQISRLAKIVGNKINGIITFNSGTIISYGRTEIYGLFQINNLSVSSPISISGNVNTTGIITLNTLTTITPYTNNTSLISSSLITVNGSISTMESLNSVFLKNSSLIYVVNTISAVSNSFTLSSFTNTQTVNIVNNGSNAGTITFGSNASNFNINFASDVDMLNMQVTGSINNDNDLIDVGFSISTSDIISITGTGVVSSGGTILLNNTHTAILNSSNSFINITNATINITGSITYTLPNGQIKTISNKNSISVLVGSISITGKGSIDITTLSSGQVQINGTSIIYGETTVNCITNINSQNITLNGSLSVLNSNCNTTNSGTSTITPDGLSLTTTDMVTVFQPTIIGIINTGTLTVDSSNKLTTILNYLSILGPPTIQLVSGYIENTYANTSSYVLLNGTLIIDKLQTGSNFITNGTINNTGIITNNGTMPNDVTINSQGNIINGTNIKIYGSSTITGSLTNSSNALSISSNSVTSITGNITIPLSSGQVQINLTDGNIKINGNLVINGTTVTIENTSNIYYLTDLTKTYINLSAENKFYSINNNQNIGIFYAKRKTGEGNDNSVSYNINWNNKGATFTNIVSYVSAIQGEIISFVDSLTGLTLFGNSNFSTTLNVDKKTASLSMKININKKLLAKNYSIQFFSQTNLPTWYRNLKIDTLLDNKFVLKIDTYSSYPLYASNKIIQVGNDGSVLIKGFSPIDVLSNPITFNSLNNTFYLRAYENGVYSRNRENDVKLTIPITYSNGVLIKYSIDKLIYIIQQVINSVTGNVSIDNTIISAVPVFENGITNNYAKIRFNIKRTYAIKDYQLVFYDTTSFVQCYTGVSSVKNITWDTTLGWLLGFQANFSYNFADFNAVNGYVSITGDSVVILNLYNYFIICIDDYNSNQINDGLVTICGKDNNNPLPSYSNIYNNLTCDPANGSITYNGAGLTQNQIYSITEIYNSNLKNNLPENKIYSSTPSIKNVFGILPIKPGNNGQTFVEYGGTLQNQDRTYYGPVNINRMSVTLYTDRGDVLNLNGANWSFSVICEQLSNLKAKN